MPISHIRIGPITRYPFLSQGLVARSCFMSVRSGARYEGAPVAQLTALDRREAGRQGAGQKRGGEPQRQLGGCAAGLVEVGFGLAGHVGDPLVGVGLADTGAGRDELRRGRGRSAGVKSAPSRALLSSRRSTSARVAGSSDRHPDRTGGRARLRLTPGAPERKTQGRGRPPEHLVHVDVRPARRFALPDAESAAVAPPTMAVLAAPSAAALSTVGGAYPGNHEAVGRRPEEHLVGMHAKPRRVRRRPAISPPIVDASIAVTIR